MEAVVPVILQHHERYDGQGYPAGLLGDDSSLLAQVLAVADAYEAMTSARPHRPALAARAGGRRAAPQQRHASSPRASSRRSSAPPPRESSPSPLSPPRSIPPSPASWPADRTIAPRAARGLRLLPPKGGDSLMDPVGLIIYLLVALLAGLIAERLVGASLPGGLIGTILAALLGVVLMVNVLHYAVPGDVLVGGIPLITAILGAALVLVLWIVLARGLRPIRRV